MSSMVMIASLLEELRVAISHKGYAKRPGS